MCFHGGYFSYVVNTALTKTSLRGIAPLEIPKALARNDVTVLMLRDSIRQPPDRNDGSYVLILR